MESEAPNQDITDDLYAPSDSAIDPDEQGAAISATKTSDRASLSNESTGMKNKAGDDDNFTIKLPPSDEGDKADSENESSSFTHTRKALTSKQDAPVTEAGSVQEAVSKENEVPLSSNSSAGGSQPSVFGPMADKLTTARQETSQGATSGQVFGTAAEPNGQTQQQPERKSYADAAQVLIIAC